MKKVLSIALVSAMTLTGIFAASSQTAQAAVTNGSQVTVEKGDTYKSIAEANGISISALEQANGRTVGGFDLIYPGETITLPGATTQSQATTTQATTQQNTQTTDTTSQATDTTATTSTQDSSATQTTATTGTSQGTFKISFYDPAVLGSNMGYSGVAANLSVFPKGTQLKITLADGTVMYRTVNDTGTFANTNSQQLDVAMPSSSIPSYGVTTATVEVLS